MQSKSKILTITLCLLTYFLNCCPCLAQQPSWQLSEEINITLGVRDKFDTLKTYEGRFVVEGPKSKTWQKTIIVTGSDWGYVKFPEDFGDYPQEGLYRWHCVVKGRIVISGQFEYHWIDGHIQRVSMDYNKEK
jgi:hypothetical protein